MVRVRQQLHHVSRERATRSADVSKQCGYVTLLAVDGKSRMGQSFAAASAAADGSSEAAFPQEAADSVLSSVLRVWGMQLF